MLTTQCVTTFLVIWACPVILAQPSLYVKIQHNKDAELAAQDEVLKHIEPAPDTHTNSSESYKKTTHTKENLISPSGDKINADTDVHRSYRKKVQDHLTHKDDGADITNDKDIGKYTSVVIHKQIDGKNKKSVFDKEGSVGDFATEKKHVLETATGGVITDKGQRAITKVELSHLDSLVKNGDRVDETERQLGRAAHVNKKTSSTVYVHDTDPDNIILAGDRDIDTDAYRDDYVSKREQSQQNTTGGQVSRTSYKVGSRKEYAVAHEHDTGAYHETPMHKFLMEDKEVEHNIKGQYTVTEDKQTEYKGNDGSTEDVEEKTRKVMNSDRAEHTDNLTMKSISKAHPGSPLTISLSTKIIDSNHYALQESAYGKKLQKLRNGGTRTVQVEEEHKKTYNMDTTPNQANY